MSQVNVPDAAEIILLKWIFKSNSSDLTLRLFSNDYTPVQGSVAGSLTEATFTGYSPASLSRSSFNSPTTVSNKAVIQYSTATTWTATSSQTIYGFYLTSDDDSDALVYVERFATARSLTSGTDLSVTPKVRLSNDDS